MFVCDATPEQRWEVLASSDGIVEIRNIGSNKCLRITNDTHKESTWVAPCDDVPGLKLIFGIGHSKRDSIFKQNFVLAELIENLVLVLEAGVF